jgi:hypothetical protein
MNRITLVLFLLICLLSAGAQTRETAATPQAPALTAALPMQEKVFVHTDKDFYLAGEILWFKLYVVDAAFHRPLDLSKLAYIEVISNEQRPVLQAKIALGQGLGYGSFQLPFSIHSGNYIVRAYTQWMRNAGPSVFFEKNVTILNSLRNDEVPTGGSAGAANGASATGSSIPGAGAAAPQGPDYDIQFFPEGGSLVQGLPNRVAFRIADRSGKGVSCKGVLINSSGDTVARFHTLRFGMGQFSFTPPAGLPCKVLLETDDHTVLTRELPRAEDRGYTMQVTDGGAGRLTISVHANVSNGDSLVRLFVHNHRSVTAIDKKNISGGEAQFVVDESTLTEGITLFTLLTGQNKPAGERLWFRRPVTLRMDLHAGQDHYGIREKVTLDLNTPDVNGAPVEMNASMAVVLQDSLQSAGQEDIVNYLLLSSDLRGRIESPAYYFTDDGPGIKETADLLMMTQGWRKLLPAAGSPAAAEAEGVARYTPEYAGLLMSGRVTDRRTGAPAGGIFAWLSAPGERFRLASAVSNKEGELQWDMGTLYGAHELVVQTGDPHTDSLYRIDLASPFSDPSIQNALPAFKWPAAAKDQLLLHSIGAQAQNAYQPDRRMRFSQPLSADTAAFYGRPDKRYLLDDYTRFTSMEEVMREYVREVKVRNSKGDFAFFVQSDQANELFFESAPLVMVDGVPIADMNTIIRFDPLKFSKMEIVTKRHVLGDSLLNGIISYSTYKGDLSGFPLDRNAYILDYEGLQLHREFYSPVYETRDQGASRIPDLRNLLYWSPEIVTGRQGRQQISFYTSDVAGQYAVILQGITADGRAVSVRTAFTVEKSARDK